MSPERSLSVPAPCCRAGETYLSRTCCRIESDRPVCQPAIESLPASPHVMGGDASLTLEAIVLILETPSIGASVTSDVKEPGMRVQRTGQSRCRYCSRVRRTQRAEESQHDAGSISMFRIGMFPASHNSKNHPPKNSS
jgi:hypothetical protein